MSPTDDPIKEALEIIKEEACAIQEITAAVMSESELTPTDKQRLNDSLTIAHQETDVVTDPGAPLAYPEPVTWTGIDASGFDISQFGETLKQQACDALEDYCRNDENGAREHLWNGEELHSPFRALIGLP